MDQFYALVTGEEEAFYNMCMVLPNVIEKVISEMEDVKVPEDRVMEELVEWVGYLDTESGDMAIAIAIYMLEFSGYNGFY